MTAGDWFQTLTGLTSDSPQNVRDRIGTIGQELILPDGRRLQAGTLTLPALAELPKLPGPSTLTFREEIADVRALHADPAHAGAVFQVASQFNLLEMVDPEVSPQDGIARYAHDRTQGPACAMACAAGTIWRNYLVPLGGQTGQSDAHQIDTTEELGRALGNADGALWQMRNGYLLPRPGALPRIAAAIAGREDALRGLLRLGVQADTQVTLPGAGHHVTQIYASALPLSYAGGAAPEWEPFARLILEAAYEATFRIAALQAATGGRPRLFLTRLGGGVFRHPEGWITDSILRAAARAKAAGLGAGLDVTLVSHGRPHRDTARLRADWPV